MEKVEVYVRSTICVGGRYVHRGMIVSLPPEIAEKEMKAGRVRYAKPRDVEDPALVALYQTYATE